MNMNQQIDMQVEWLQKRIPAVLVHSGDALLELSPTGEKFTRN